jgi:hypothetical protein
MTTPPRPPCTCPPYPGGHHGIHLHADQVDDLVDLLLTIEHWLLQTSYDVHLDLHHYLTTHRPHPTRHHLADQVDNLIHQLTTTPQDWLQHPTTSLDEHHPPPHTPDPLDQLLDQLATTAGQLTRAGHDPRLAWTPC